MVQLTALGEEGVQMHRLLITVVAGVSAIAFMRSASAADLPLKAPIEPLAYNWTGFYAGLNGGFGWGRNNADFTGDGQNNAGNDLISRVFDGPLSFSQKTRSQEIDADGAFGGAQFGYNWQVTNVWVAGLEADIHASALRGNFTRAAPLIALSLNAEQKLNWFGTARGRLGYLVTERILVFGTAGLAYGETEETSNFFGNGTFIGASNQHPLRRRFTLPWRPGFEYLSRLDRRRRRRMGRDQQGHGQTRISSPCTCSNIVMAAIPPATGNATVAANFRNQYDTARVGLNLRF
jgi:outer membrane immunogenic protein